MTTIVDFPLSNFLDPDVAKFVTIRRTLSQFERIIKRIPLFRKYVTNSWDRKNWFLECKGSKLVILFDTFHNYHKYAKVIEEVADCDARLVLYLWNPASYSSDYLELSTRWEVWSFSKNDSLKLNCKYADTFYNPELVINNHEMYTTDLFFIGTDKGRRSILHKIKSELETRNVKTDIRIVDNTRAKFDKSYSTFTSYDVVRRLISQSKCLLEINQQGQTGLTLRTMEALFFNKKLITNNVAIKAYPFFDANNFFVIGEHSSWEEIVDFLNKPTISNVKWLDKFEFSNWLYRLENNIESDIK